MTFYHCFSIHLLLKSIANSAFKADLSSLRERWQPLCYWRMGNTIKFHCASNVFFNFCIFKAPSHIPVCCVEFFFSLNCIDPYQKLTLVLQLWNGCKWDQSKDRQYTLPSPGYISRNVYFIFRIIHICKKTRQHFLKLLRDSGNEISFSRDKGTWQSKSRWTSTVKSVAVLLWKCLQC